MTTINIIVSPNQSAYLRHPGLYRCYLGVMQNQWGGLRIYMDTKGGDGWTMDIILHPDSIDWMEMVDTDVVNILRVEGK